MANPRESTLSSLEQLIVPIAESEGAYLIDLIVRGERGGKVVEVFLDSDAGLSTGTCAAISRAIATALDETEILTGKYNLVVSSPGIERPLKYLRQYAKHIGRQLQIEVRTTDGSRELDGKLVGKLVAVGDGNIVLSLNADKANTQKEIDFGDIVGAKVLPAW